MDYITYEGLRQHGLIYSRSIVFWITLPMRDWDIPCLLIYVWAQNADYITYEGLRQVQWNFNWRIFFMDYITYEGLRPAISCRNNLGMSRITLPMRDWDTPFFIMLPSRLTTGLHYLWGIETNLSRNQSGTIMVDYITYEGLRPISNITCIKIT